MKTQIGVVFGMNVAVACLMLGGCKATRPEAPNKGGMDTVVVQPEPAPAAAPETEVKPLPPEVKPVPAKPAPVKPVATIEPAAKPAPVAEGTVYVVQRGDILSRICLKNRVRRAEVLALNPGLKPDKLFIGQKIKLPASVAPVAVAPAKTVKKVSAEPAAKAEPAVKAAPAAKADAASVKAPVAKKAAFKPYTGATKEYVVKNGDSLGKIAYENGITIRALKELNGLKKDALKLGQKIKIPAEKQVAAPKAKEAPKAAAAKKPADAPKAAEAAPAPAPAAEAPKAAEAAPAPAPAPAAEAPTAAEPAPAPAPAAEAAPAPAPAPAAEPAPAPAPAAETYTVKENEDVVTIAINFGISPSALMDLNNLKTGDALKPGQVLKIPAGAKAAK